MHRRRKLHCGTWLLSQALCRMCEIWRGVVPWRHNVFIWQTNGFKPPHGPTFLLPLTNCLAFFNKYQRKGSNLADQTSCNSNWLSQKRLHHHWPTFFQLYHKKDLTITDQLSCRSHQAAVDFLGSHSDIYNKKDSVIGIMNLFSYLPTPPVNITI